MKMLEDYNVGIYCRLSRDDANGDLESMSIGNQRQILTDYVNEKGWTLTEIYIDDGYTGTNFERPDFKRMIKDIKLGRINCVITKDLSRLGRNYVQTGYYQEEFFMEYDVRYIALNDAIDTANDNNEIAPFKNILNEYYPRAVSKAVKQVRKKGAEQGKFMGSKPPFGYLKSPENRHMFVVDEIAGPIISWIFTRYAAGDSARFIATQLNDKGVLSPRAYYYSLIGRQNPNANESATWCSNTVSQLLKNQAYIGHMVQGKRSVVSFKTKRRKFTNTEDHIIVENTHEPIVNMETWNAVHKRLLSGGKTRMKKDATISLFSGIIKCADCGGTFSFHAKQLASRIRNTYMCSRYINHGKKACSAHYILEEQLLETVKQDINKYAYIATEDREALIQNLLSSVNKGRNHEIQFYKTKIHEIKKRIGIIDSSIKSLFEEKCAGNVSDNIFKSLLADYERERSGLEKKIPELRQNMVDAETANTDVSEWVSRIKKYMDLEELDRDILTELIDTHSELKHLNYPISARDAFNCFLAQRINRFA